MALITPGPVVITVAFIRYFVAGAAGATVAAVGFPARLFLHDRAGAVVSSSQGNLQLRAFAAGATTAASGAISGAVVVLGRGASQICQRPHRADGTVLLIRFRVREPLLVLGAGLVGLALSRQ